MRISSTGGWAVPDSYFSKNAYGKVKFKVYTTISQLCNLLKCESIKFLMNSIVFNEGNKHRAVKLYQ